MNLENREGPKPKESMARRTAEAFYRRFKDDEELEGMEEEAALNAIEQAIALLETVKDGPRKAFIIRKTYGEEKNLEEIAKELCKKGPEIGKQRVLELKERSEKFIIRIAGGKSR